MATTLTERFRFISPVQTETPFHVTGFTGVEGLHRLFDFHIDLVCADAAVDTGKLLAAPCRFEILRDGDAAPAVFSGYPARVEQRGFFNGYAYYSVHLRPTLWKLTQLRQSAVFLNKKLEDVLRELINSQTFFQFPHEFRLTAGDYPAPEFAMQYQETLYDYICWRMEEQGAYFYFEEKDGADKVIFADAPQSHDAGAAPTLFYAPASGLEGDRREEIIVSFSLAQTPLPRRVVLRSYDWRNPNKPVVGMADVDVNGLGDVYLSNEYVDNDADAARLATIRAQELRCRGRLFHGASSAPTLRPGRIFRLDRHYSPAFNRDYLVTEITHEGRQDAYLTLGLGIPLRDADERLYYRNSFTCMEADVPYRPARTAPRTHIPGVLRAFVAGDGSGARAEMDEHGRYKLLFPFDLSGRTGGNVSCWIRRAQPQVGKDSGLSLPLLPGTEVLVSFVDGNPDLPVIAGALANGETGSISGSGNANFQGLRTPGGNQITINDTDNKQGISLATAAGSGLTVAAGSTESALLDAAHITQAAGAASTQMAGFGLSQISGFKVSSGAFRFDKNAYWPAFCAALADAAGAVTGTLSSHSSDAAVQNGLDWGTASAKILSAIANFVGDTIVGLGTPGLAYGGAILAQEDMAKSLLQVAPSTGDMLSAVIPYFAGRLTGVTFDSIAVGTEVEGTDPDLAYKAALEDAATALYNFNKETYAKYEKPQFLLTEPCSYYAEVRLDLSNAIAALPNSAVEQAQKELYAAETAYQNAKKLYENINKNISIYGETAAQNAKTLLDNAATTLAAAQKNACEQETATQKNTQQKEKFEEILTRLDSTWLACCGKDKDSLAYYTNKKQESGRSYMVNTLTSLLPEIVSLILFFRSFRFTKNNRLGGILLRAKDRNITMTAQDSVATHAQRGILRNTRELPQAGPDSDVALGRQDNITRSPAYLGVLEAFGGRNSLVSDADKAANLAAANAWGTAVQGNRHATDFMQEIDTQRWYEGNNVHPPQGQQQDESIRKGATFIADTTELEYRRNRWSYQRSEENAVILGDRELLLKGGDGAVAMQTHQAGAPSLFLSTSHRDGQIQLISQNTIAGAPCTEASFAPELIKLGCLRQPDAQDDLASLSMSPDELTLKREQSSIGMDRDGVFISMEGKAVVACLPQEKIRLAGKTIDIGNVQISDNKIVGTGNGVLDIGGGAIKITGARATINNADLNKKLEDLEKKLQTEMEKTFSKDAGKQLEERITALAKLQKEKTEAKK